MIHTLGIIVYLYLFIVYAILMYHPKNTKDEKIFFSIVFGIGILAPTSVIW